VDLHQRRGVDEVFVANLDGLTTLVSTLNAEQEALKARLKEKSAALDKAFASLKKGIFEGRKVVKMDVAQPGWREYGILDSK
jgi:hypothetical protein